MDGKVPRDGQGIRDKVPLPLPPSKQSQKLETYVIQIPREQIYRVPPKEHARIIERYLEPSKENKNRCTPCAWILGAMVLISIIIGVSVSVTRSLYSPMSPKFSVTKFATQVSSASKHKHKSVGFHISVKANNPGGMGISYQKGGNSILSFNENKVARGDFPKFFQDGEDSTTQKVTLTASKSALPEEIEERLDRTTTSWKRPVHLVLNINMPVKFTSWAKSVGNKELSVSCNFKVNKLYQGSKILSQQCRTKIKEIGEEEEEDV